MKKFLNLSKTLFVSFALGGALMTSAIAEQPSSCPYSQLFLQNSEPTTFSSYESQWYGLPELAPEPSSHASESLGDIVLRLTNLARADHGLAPLEGNFSLDKAALGHSDEMLRLNYFSHYSPTPERSSPQQRVRLAGADPARVSENIFQCSGYDPAAAAALAVETWLESPGHRQNILDPQATHIGIGITEQNGDFAVTQLFGAGF